MVRPTRGVVLRLFCLCTLLLIGSWAKAQSKFTNETYATLHARAEAGDAEAENELGVRFRTGDGVEKDLLTALGWYRLAAKQGLAIAYFNLGAAYYNGDGIPREEQAACTWFLLAAEAGDPSGKEAYAREKEDSETNHGTVCMVLAGDAYLKGTEITKDEKHAVQMYTAAAAGGNTLANTRLYVVYSEGLGVPKDLPTARQWLQAAAESTKPDRVYRLTCLRELQARRRELLMGRSACSGAVAPGWARGERGSRQGLPVLATLGWQRSETENRVGRPCLHSFEERLAKAARSISTAL
jgi:TPR repeat protein